MNIRKGLARWGFEVGIAAMIGCAGLVALGLNAYSDWRSEVPVPSSLREPLTCRQFLDHIDRALASGQRTTDISATHRRMLEAGGDRPAHEVTNQFFSRIAEAEHAEGSEID